MPDDSTKPAQGVTEAIDTGKSGAYSKHDSVLIKSIFKASPLYTQKPIDQSSDKKPPLTPATVEYKKWFFDNVVNGTVDGTHFGLPANFNLDFNTAPDVASVKTSGEKEDLASPYMPNLQALGPKQSPTGEELKAQQADYPPTRAMAPFTGKGHANPKDTSTAQGTIAPNYVKGTAATK